MPQSLCFAVVLLTACSTVHVTVAPRELLHHVVDLRTHGEAEVDVSPSGTEDVEIDQIVTIGAGTNARKSSVKDLIANCPDIAPFAGDTFRRDPPCLLLDIHEPIEVTTRHKSRVTGKMILGGFLAVIIVTVVGSVIVYLDQHKE